MKLILVGVCITVAALVLRAETARGQTAEDCLHAVAQGLGPKNNYFSWSPARVAACHPLIVNSALFKATEVRGRYCTGFGMGEPICRDEVVLPKFNPGARWPRPASLPPRDDADLRKLMEDCFDYRLNGVTSDVTSAELGECRARLEQAAAQRPAKVNRNIFCFAVGLSRPYALNCQARKQYPDSEFQHDLRLEVSAYDDRARNVAIIVAEVDHFCKELGLAVDACLPLANQWFNYSGRVPRGFMPDQLTVCWNGPQLPDGRVLPLEQRERLVRNHQKTSPCN